MSEEQQGAVAEIAPNLPVTVTFDEDLACVRFWYEGRPVDPRVVMTGLAMGRLQVTFEQETGSYGHTPPRHYVRAQRWEIVASGTLAVAGD